MAGDFQQRELSGSLFPNDKKTKDSHPDYRGDCKIEGVDYWLSAWVKTGARGKFLSIAFSPKDETKRSNDDFLSNKPVLTNEDHKKSYPTGNIDFDKDVPF